MLKKIYILIDRIVSLYKKNRLVFILFIVVQIITIFAYTFFFTTIINTRANYVSQYTSMRTIKTDLKKCKLDKQITNNVVSIIRNNNISDIENISMFFIDNTNTRQLVGYLYPNKFSKDVFGSPISLEDIQKGSYVVIPRNADNRYNPNVEQYSIGDNMVIINKNFKVKGIRKYYYLDEIPYTTGLKFLTLSAFDIILPDSTSDKQKEMLKKYLETNIKNIKVILPESIPEKVITSLFIPLVSSIFIGLIAIFNFTFLYKYMIEKSRKDYILLRICGCSRLKSILLLFSQMAFLFTISYFISLIVLLILKKTNVSIFSQTSITISNCLVIYISFLSIIILAITPFLISVFKKSLIANQKLL